jgi:hypothetical protein
LGIGSEGLVLGVCVGNVPSQAKYSRQGSFFVCVAVWGMCHLRPNIPDRGLFLCVWLCGECAISGQTFQTGVFYCMFELTLESGVKFCCGLRLIPTLCILNSKQMPYLGGPAQSSRLWVIFCAGTLLPQILCSPELSNGSKSKTK